MAPIPSSKRAAPPICPAMVDTEQLNMADVEHLDMVVSYCVADAGLASPDPSTIGSSGSSGSTGTISIREAINRGLPGVFRNPSRCMLDYIRIKWGNQPPHNVVYDYPGTTFTIDPNTLQTGSPRFVISFGPPPADTTAEVG